MMLKTDLLKPKYPLANLIRLPLDDCPRCSGTGEYQLNDGREYWCSCMALPHPDDQRRRIIEHTVSIQRQARDKLDIFENRERQKAAWAAKKRLRR